MRRVHVQVRGRVQGVFFRASCVDQARALRLVGWIRNTLDDGVEAEFEGDEDAVVAMIAWCREGPRLAAVEGVEVRDIDPTGDDGFRVVR
jgi:acylphosphatase